jgi:hypothetical protein
MRHGNVTRHVRVTQHVNASPSVPLRRIVTAGVTAITDPLGETREAADTVIGGVGTVERATMSPRREGVARAGIGPARGIAISVALGGLAWGAIAFLALWLRELL